MPDETDEKSKANKWAVMGGIALNVEYTRKYSFEATGAARVTARLVAIPAPAAFQEAVRADVIGRQKRETPVGTAPAGPEEPQLPEEPEDELSAPGITDAGMTDDEEVLTLAVPEAAGVAYTLDDGVNPPSSGEVSEDGVLTHRISPASPGAVVRFANRQDPVILVFDRSDESEIDGAAADDELLAELLSDEVLVEYVLDIDEGIDEFDEDELEDGELEDEDLEDGELEDGELGDGEPGEEPLAAGEMADYEDEDVAEEIANRSSEEDTPVLSLFAPDKANVGYTLNDGISPESTGVVSEDGLLIHPVAPEATSASLKFDDEAEAIQLSFAAE